MRKLVLSVVIVAIFALLPVSPILANEDATWTQTSKADFMSGTLENVDASTSPGDVLLSKIAETYVPEGTLTSNTLSAGYYANFGSLSFSLTRPAGTDLKFQLASNKDNFAWNFVGPNGNSNAYYTTSGTNVWAGHNGDFYLKYKAFLFTADNGVTPELHDISITYQEITWDSYKENWLDQDGVQCDYFSDYHTEHRVFMYGTGFTPGQVYQVIYWDGAIKRVVDSGILAEVDGKLRSTWIFDPEKATEGDWQVAVYDQAADPSSYLAIDPEIVADDISYGGFAFHVTESAIPEFPTIIAGIVVVGTCALLYFWMRKRRFTYKFLVI